MRSLYLAGAVLALTLPQPLQAQGFLDSLKEGAADLGLPAIDGSGGSDLPAGTIADGLREALTVGIDTVTSQLGAPGGFLDDEQVRIPLPGPLADAQSALRLAGLSGMADDLEVRMNRAAEAAVPITKDLFVEAVSALTFDDVMEIYNGADDAATRYLEDTTGDELSVQMRPIVDEALSEAGAVQAFDSLAGDVSGLPLVGDIKTDLTDHVLGHAQGALFDYLAIQEQAIREDPAARTTDLLQTVFSG